MNDQELAESGAIGGIADNADERVSGTGVHGQRMSAKEYL